MIRGRQREAWLHTSHWMAQLWETTRPIRQFFVKDKIPAKTADDFNPFELAKRSRRKPLSMVDQINAMAPVVERRKKV